MKDVSSDEDTDDARVARTNASCLLDSDQEIENQNVSDEKTKLRSFKSTMKCLSDSEETTKLYSHKRTSKCLTDSESDFAMDKEDLKESDKDEYVKAKTKQMPSLDLLSNCDQKDNCTKNPLVSDSKVLSAQNIDRLTVQNADEDKDSISRFRTDTFGLGSKHPAHSSKANMQDNDLDSTSESSEQEHEIDSKYLCSGTQLKTAESRINKITQEKKRQMFERFKELKRARAKKIKSTR